MIPVSDQGLDAAITPRGIGRGARFPTKRRSAGAQARVQALCDEAYTDDLESPSGDREWMT